MPAVLPSQMENQYTKSCVTDTFQMKALESKPGKISSMKFSSCGGMPGRC
jgi:hypothetical protein